MVMYVLRLIRTPDKEYKSPRSLGVRVNESRLYIYISYIYIYRGVGSGGDGGDSSPP